MDECQFPCISYLPIFPATGDIGIQTMIYDLILLGQSSPAASPAAGGAGPTGPSFLIPFVCIIVIFYFMVIRPQSKRQKEQQTLVSALKTGDKVVTAAGIHGMISNVKETTVILKVADNVKIEVDKASIGTVTKRSDAEAGASASQS